MFVENGYEPVYFKEYVFVNVYFIYKYIFIKVFDYFTKHRFQRTSTDSFTDA